MPSPFLNTFFIRVYSHKWCSKASLIFRILLYDFEWFLMIQCFITEYLRHWIKTLTLQLQDWTYFNIGANAVYSYLISCYSLQNIVTNTYFSILWYGMWLDSLKCSGYVLQFKCMLRECMACIMYNVKWHTSSNVGWQLFSFICIWV